jgi:L-serine dehydratase
VTPPGLPRLRFDPETDLVFDYGPPLPGHANGLVLRAYDEAGASTSRKPITPSAAAS